MADRVRTDSHQLRQVAGDSELAEAITVVGRAYKTLIWERTRHVQRLRHALQEFFPAAVEAFEDLIAPDALELLGKAADPTTAARLTRTQITAALRRARRRHVTERAEQVRSVLRAEQLTQPPAVAAAYAATVRSQVAVLATLNTEIATWSTRWPPILASTRPLRSSSASLDSGPSSAPGCCPSSVTTLTATPTRKHGRTTPAPVRSPAIRPTEIRPSRYVHNDRLLDALGRQAFTALTASPASGAYYDELRDRGKDHNAALRQLANRLIGILHGCLKTNTTYDEITAWPAFNEATA